jgi:subtilisin family serine protease
VQLKEESTMTDHSIKFWSQFEAVQAAAAAQGTVLAVYPPTAKPGGDEPQYVYEHEWFLARADVAADSEKREHLGVEPPDPDDHGPVRRLRVNAATSRRWRREGAAAIEETLNKLDAFPGAATPNHLISICPDVNLCPADEPYPVPGDSPLWPPFVPAHGGAEIHIEVIDTGLVPDHSRHPWLAGSEVQGGPRIPWGPAPVSGDPVQAWGPTTGLIREYAGHGTMVAGLLRCVAPAAAKVYVSNALQFAGATMEHDLGAALLAALNKNPDIISLSAGGTTRDGRSHLGLQQFLTELAARDRTLLVAAAGNEGSERVLQPAASHCESVLSVGALRSDLTDRACFSNYGREVDVYAPGERLVNAFTTGDYRYVDPPSLSCRYSTLYCPCPCVTAPPQGAQVHFEGMARWSGTSFGTPIVAGLVAAYMTGPDKLSSRKAARQLLLDRGFDLPGGHGRGVVPISMDPHD